QLRPPRHRRRRRGRADEGVQGAVREAAGASGLSEFEDWSHRQFRRHFSLEKAGVSPSRLSKRWLVLNRMVYGPKQRVRLNLPEAVAHWLDDDDVRSKSQEYATSQRLDVEAWLDA